MVMRAHAARDAKRGNMDEIENRDYVMQDGRTIRPDGIRARFDALRPQIFDRKVSQRPVKQESDYAVGTKGMSAEQLYSLNNSEYNFDTPTSDRRIKNPFQYYTYMLSGIGTNISVLLAKKRQIQRCANDIEVTYQTLYADAIGVYGKKEMGANQDERKAWMRRKYPALVEVRELYVGFLGEIDIEYDNLDMKQQIVSRCITGIENDVKMRGEYAWGNASDKASRHMSVSE